MLLFVLSPPSLSAEGGPHSPHPLPACSLPSSPTHSPSHSLSTQASIERKRRRPSERRKRQGAGSRRKEQGRARKEREVGSCKQALRARKKTVIAPPGALWSVSSSLSMSHVHPVAWSCAHASQYWRGFCYRRRATPINETLAALSSTARPSGRLTNGETARVCSWRPPSLDDGLNHGGYSDG